jgi:hypothetical protein
MKPIFIAFTIAALLGIAATANAWLGDSPDALIQRYGKPKLVELTTGDIPTQKGYYAELREKYSTNANPIAYADTNYSEIGYGMENRTRYTFEKDGLTIVAYIGNAGDKYNGADFAGRSAREIINCGTVWEKNKNGDKFTHPVPLSPAVINAALEDNKGDSTWTNDWQPYSIPGTYLKRTSDKARLAIAHGPSEHEIYRLEVRMTNARATD